MKIGILGLEDFGIGKKLLPDARLEKLEKIFHPPKTTPIYLEFIDSKLEEAEGLLIERDFQLDLVLKDLERIEGLLSKASQDKRELLSRCKNHLEKEEFLAEITLDDKEIIQLKNWGLLTLKPYLIVEKENISFSNLILEIYQKVGRISFFTVNERELRAWSIKRGLTAYEAAGIIHSDIKRGFIKAEVIGYEDLIRAGSLNRAKAEGLLRLEDKDYVVKDADLIKFRFSL